MQQWFLPYETPTYTQHTQKGVPTKPCTGHSHSRFFSGIFDWAFTNLRTNFRIPLKESIHLKPHLNEHAGLKTCPQISWPSSCQEKCDLCSSPLNLDSAFACQIKCGESDAMSLYINSGLENWQHLLLSVEMLIVGTQPPCFEEAQAAHGEPLPPRKRNWGPRWTPSWQHQLCGHVSKPPGKQILRSLLQLLGKADPALPCWALPKLQIPEPNKWFLWFFSPCLGADC